jgi:hypothetical protein
MKCGDKVRVKLLANVEHWFRGRTGTVDADSGPGEVVQVSLDDEAAAYPFQPEDLDLIG